MLQKSMVMVLMFSLFCLTGCGSGSSSDGSSSTSTDAITGIWGSSTTELSDTYGYIQQFKNGIYTELQTTGEVVKRTTGRYTLDANVLTITKLDARMDSGSNRTLEALLTAPFSSVVSVGSTLPLEYWVTFTSATNASLRPKGTQSPSSFAIRMLTPTSTPTTPVVTKSIVGTWGPYTTDLMSRTTPTQNYVYRFSNGNYTQLLTDGTLILRYSGTYADSGSVITLTPRTTQSCTYSQQNCPGTLQSWLDAPVPGITLDVYETSISRAYDYSFSISYTGSSTGSTEAKLCTQGTTYCSWFVKLQ